MRNWPSASSVFHLKPWQYNAAFAGLLKSFERILPLRTASDLISGEARERIHKLTFGVTARNLRLIETAAEDAARAGKEQVRLPVGFPPEAQGRLSS